MARVTTAPSPEDGLESTDNGLAESPAVEPDGGSPKYPAEHFFNSRWYTHRRDKLKVLLDVEQEYSYADVDLLLLHSQK